ncbi:serine hydrolase domain-containing protein [Micromonospora eburnea]|uniref:D-alanyl-D-alanine carboxypeptidase n=1 Tax=Micromonospora eburnea TaxID=227316 RepID=A0A1C6U9K7_9ACTN|nr:serine hydrolase domain-containing protein [Micromonospora eburnea]SCL50712.1 D-alanyl-D-alanine carboxypeptidase [Micromonospora eburnea]
MGLTRRAALAGIAGCGAALAAGHPGTAAFGRSGQEARPDLRSALDAVVAAGAVWAIAEVRTNSSVWRGASGTAELGGTRPAPVGGRYRAGSVTKTFVATVVLQLVGEGRLGLDDSLQHWLPGLAPDDAAITVRNLLQHTSGLYDYTAALLPDNDSFLRIRFTTFTPSQLVAVAAAHPAAFPPGTGQAYSNTDYILLGMLIERVTGRPYRDEIRLRLLDPLGLRHTQLPGTFPLVTGPHANLYIPVKRQGRTVPVDVTMMNPSMAGAAGEIISTTAELNRFYRALIGGRLLRPSELRDMRNPRGTGFGLGLEVAELDGTTVVGHGGGGPGFLGLSFTSLNGTHQITLTTAPWGGDPTPAMMAMLNTALAPVGTVQTPPTQPTRAAGTTNTYRDQ